MSSLWDEGRSIKKEVDKEITNLFKSKGGRKSLVGILTKTQELQEKLLRFEINTENFKIGEY